MTCTRSSAYSSADRHQLAIIGRAEAFASKNTVDRALMDGLFMGIGFTGALVALGALREVIGTGTLLARADLMFGDIAHNWAIRVFDDYEGFLLAILPPGAFIGLGLLIAVKNIVDARSARRVASMAKAVTVSSQGEQTAPRA